jgi:hypothetical protein
MKQDASCIAQNEQKIRFGSGSEKAATKSTIASPLEITSGNRRCPRDQKSMGVPVLMIKAGFAAGKQIGHGPWQSLGLLLDYLYQKNTIDAPRELQKLKQLGVIGNIVIA